jgi:diacylglycerol kinase family enzyme
VLRDLRRLARRLAGPLAGLVVMLTLAGLLLDALDEPRLPFEVTEPALRWVQALGEPLLVVPASIVVALAMRAAYHRWREGVFLLATVVTIGTALLVARLVAPGAGDPAFPAVQTGLAAAWYGAVAIVVRRRLHGTWVAAVPATALALVGLGVATSQLLLGEHRPVAVLVTLLAGTAATGTAARLVLRGEGFEERPSIFLLPTARRAAVIVNPTKLDDVAEQRRAVTAFLNAAGWGDPLWLETTIDDTGRGMAEQAAAAGVDVVFGCGGDGTIMSVLTGLAGTGVPLALLPAGTGNLLARNLELPYQDRDACLRIGLHGSDRKLDVGRVEGAGRFAVMAGIGYDAAIVTGVPEGLKRRVGWTAYVVPALRHLLDKRMTVTVRVDEAEPVQLRARGVIIGNVGRLQAGLLLMPDARPDDGVLDVVVLAPKTFGDWARLIWHVISRRPGPTPRVARFRGRRIEIIADKVCPRQVDGDGLEAGDSMIVEVEPQALVVRVPARPAVEPD